MEVWNPFVEYIEVAPKTKELVERVNHNLQTITPGSSQQYGVPQSCWKVTSQPEKTDNMKGYVP